jgi:ATP-dependent DNA ligase
MKPSWMVIVAYGRKALRSGRGEGICLQPGSPRLLMPVRSSPPDTLIDGEVVAIDGDGCVSFNALQHDISSSMLSAATKAPS